MSQSKNAERKQISKTRRILGDIFIFLVLIFTAYVSVVMLYRISTVVLKSVYTKIFFYELGFCAVFLILALDARFGFFTKIPLLPLKILGWIFRVIICAAAGIILFFLVKITVGSLINTENDTKYTVVLGQALEDGKPTKDLLYRIETAKKHLEKYPDSVLILTGGNPDKTGKTEAAAMKEILLADGVPEEKMILEDKAGSTKENFENTAEMLDADTPIILISSNYHMDRATMEAKDAGFKTIYRMPAPSSAVFYGVNVLWEVVLEINKLTLNQK